MKMNSKDRLRIIKMSKNNKKKSTVILRKESLHMNTKKNISQIIISGQLLHQWENILNHLKNKYKI